jgi:hypothetical protein
MVRSEAETWRTSSADGTHVKRNVVNDFLSKCRVALAFKEVNLYKSKSFTGEVVEVDGGKVFKVSGRCRRTRRPLMKKIHKKPASKTKKEPRVTTHMGRFIVLRGRQSAEFILAPLAQKTTLKGAGGPPEETREVMNILAKKLGKATVIASDAGHGIKKACTLLNQAQLKGAKHYVDEYSPSVRIAKKDLPDDTKDMLSRLALHENKYYKPMSTVSHPTSTKKKPATATLMKKPSAADHRMSCPGALERSRDFLLVGGDNLAENVIGMIKNTLRRQNLLGRSSEKRQHVDLLAAASLLREPGYFAVCKALAEYREWALLKGIRPGELFEQPVIDMWLKVV